MPVAKPESSDVRIIAHVDMDCFYVQVEQRKQPQLRGLPTAVVQYNSWKGGGLIAVGYEARKFGVKRSMRGDEAKKVCPQIQLVQVPVARGKADLKTYRDAGSEVVSVLSKKGRCERASIDEVYLDLTDAAEAMLIETPPESMEFIDVEALKSHVLGLDQEGQSDSLECVRMWLTKCDADYRDKLLACGTLIVAELRMQVLRETKFTCSAGIAHNKMLAKLASAMNKPAQQTVVPLSCVKGLLDLLPIKKMKQLGGKLGSSLESDLGVNTVGDLLKFSEQKLQECYGINTGTWLWNIARGISGEEVECRLLPKSHGSGKSFPGPQALRTISSVQHWLTELSEELSERLCSDLDKNRRMAHTLTLHASAYRLSDSDSHKKFPSKSCPLRYGAAKIQEDALNLFKAALRDYLGSYRANTQGDSNSGWRITSLSVSASKIMTIPSGTCSITKYLHVQHSSCTSSGQPQDNDIQETALHPGCTNYSMMNSNEAHDERTGETKIELDYSHLGCTNYSVDSSEALDKFTGEEKEGKATDRCNLDEEEGGRGSWKEEVMDTCSSSKELEKDGVIIETTQLPVVVAGSSKSEFQIIPIEEQKSKNTRITSSLCTKRNKSKDKGTASILRFFKPDHSSTSRNHEFAESIQDNLSSADGHSSELRLSDHGEQGGERWNYKVDEIDISVIEELPPEMQKEIWSWLRPHKRSNTANRGSTLAHYFLPSKSS
ncbi:DNA polymerase eta isoform X2 [Benincasa hispida]|uniref:DNA polymerase eta isoform X2 n=1 Tax=Benincasa hispida TaxID=102211 RepID=UPI001901E713|nr:DNA polymerase eta isoform X2 [Benincasa hispida]